MSEQQIAKILINLAEYFDKILTPVQIQMYSRDLSDLSAEDLNRAICLYCRSHDRFPLPAQIRKMITPSDDNEARDAIARVVFALHKFNDPYCHKGSQKEQKAKEYIGELGWLVVQRVGGWMKLCNLGDDDIGPIAQAQWRELAISFRNKSRIGVLDQAPGLDFKSTRTKHGSLEGFGSLKIEKNGS